MPTNALAISAACLLTALSGCSGDPNQRDLEQLQGEWAAVSVVSKSKTMDEKDVRGFKVFVKGHEWRPTMHGKEAKPSKLSIKLDATKTPKEIDLVFMAPDREAILRGIYKLEGDTLTVCRSNIGDERPMEFSSGAEEILEVYERGGNNSDSN